MASQKQTKKLVGGNSWHFLTLSNHKPNQSRFSTLLILPGDIEDH